MELSIIVINYRCKDYLEGCLASIERYLADTPLKNKFEVILVNNEETDLKINKSFSFLLKIINQNKNIGFGAANNLGAQRAVGNFLFFLNPDTKLFDYGIIGMLEYLKSDDSVGIVGPKIILAQENRPQPWTSGSKTTFWNIVFRNSINKSWNREKITTVDWVSGTAFVLRKPDFIKVGGFDENFFMYFEDQDLCLRIKNTGKKNVFYPHCQIVHFNGKSWNNKDNKKRIFYQSQNYFFSKHNPPWQKSVLALAKSFLGL